MDLYHTFTLIHLFEDEPNPVSTQEIKISRTNTGIFTFQRAFAAMTAIIGNSVVECGSVTCWYRSVPLTYGSGSFRQWLTRCQQKKGFFQNYFAYYRYSLKIHLHQFS
jgi:hypothetical protein